MWDCSSPTRIKPVPLAVEEQNLNYWTIREVCFKIFNFSFSLVPVMFHRPTSVLFLMTILQKKRVVERGDDFFSSEETECAMRGI